MEVAVQARTPLWVPGELSCARQPRLALRAGPGPRTGPRVSPTLSSVGCLGLCRMSPLLPFQGPALGTDRRPSLTCEVQRGLPHPQTALHGRPFPQTVLSARSAQPGPWSHQGLCPNS